MIIIMRKILISGYYGFKNSGDDALLSCIISDICECTERDKIVVLSANPEETSRIYRVNAIDRLNIISIAAHMTRADLLISGGGTLVQDGTSTKSLMYYLGIILMARFFGLKTMLYANGIGPLIRKKNKKRTKRVLEGVDMITLRDMRSAAVLNEIGINKNIHVTADPVFGISGISKARGRAVLNICGVPKNIRCIGISVRGRKNSSDEFIDETAAAISESAQKYNLFPVLIPMQKSKDMEICKALKEKLSCDSAVIHADMNVNEMLSVVSNMEFCIGMRLHMLIYAAVACIPVIGLVYDPKVSGFMQYTDQNFYLDVDNITKDALMRLIDEILGNYDEIRDKLCATKEKMYNISRDNVKYLMDLIDETDERENKRER